MRSGRILRFDEARGYGFIVPEGGGEDVFVHANELVDDKHLFTPGQAVEFEVTEGERGLKAFAVRLADGGPEPRRAPQVPVDDRLSDVLTRDEFLDEVTETLLAEVPSLTGQQITQVRTRLLKLADKHGWIDD